MPAAPKLTDVHVHLAALPDLVNGCRLSPRMRRSVIFRFLAWRLGAALNDPETTNRLYVEKLAAALRGSVRAGKAVLLAMDGVYDAAGRLDEGRTDFLVSNDHLFSVVKNGGGRFLAGVSVNPLRRDALDELERCALAGAVLVKVVPNSQGFDPADRALVPFWRALARLRLPLLSHVGYEFSLLGRDQSAGEPARLRAALDEGVTVIAAHGGGIGLPFSDKYSEDMRALFARHPRFFADTSAVTLPNRRQTLEFLRDHPEVHGRLLFGTDYPLPVNAWTSVKGLPASDVRAAARLTNPFDRQAFLLDSWGIKFGSFPDALATPS